MYSLFGYGSMIADSIRTDAYAKALEIAIKPNTVVLDIGTGTGILALLACQLGAKKVYAIEPSDLIQVAREIAAVNGYSDRIEFIQAISTQIALPESVDVIVADLRGVLPLFQHLIPSLADACQRFLGPNGILIPQQETLWATIVEAPDLYHFQTSPWSNNPYGVNMESVHRFVTNGWCKAKVKSEQCLAVPQQWAILDYKNLVEPDVKAEFTLAATRSGTVHGLCLWFDTIFINEIGFSNAPGQPDTVYGKAFFPLSNPVELVSGDTITVQLKANLVGDDYIWSWNTKFLEQGNSNNIKASYQQSTFFGAPLTFKELRKQSDRFIPQLNTTGKIDMLVLSLMEQGKSLGVIAQQLTEQFSDRFPTWKDALTYVGEASQRYSS